MSATLGNLIARTDSYVSRPRARALIDGVDNGGLVSFTVEQNNYARGDTFQCEIIPAVGATWFNPIAGSQHEAIIQGADLQQGAPEGSATGWTTLIQGLIDSTHFDPIQRKLQFQGRDYSSKLIELGTSIAVFLSMTSSEIAAQLASQAGLSANIIPTTAYVGQYYQIDHKRHGLAAHSKQTTAWDILTRLARIERYDVWVSGKTLNFVPQLDTSVPPLILPFEQIQPAILDQARAQNPGVNPSYVPQTLVETLSLQAEAGISRGIKVTVVSWDSKQRRVTNVSWPPEGSLAAAKGNAQQYTFKLPNLTYDKAKAEAIAYYNQILAHQSTVTFSMPGDWTLTPRQRVQLTGTPQFWATTYRIDSIHREFGWGGFKQTVTMRNRDAVALDTDGQSLDDVTVDAPMTKPPLVYI